MIAAMAAPLPERMTTLPALTNAIKPATNQPISSRVSAVVQNLSLIWFGILTTFAMKILLPFQKIYKMRKSVFYHAGCTVCVNAEQDIVSLLGAETVEVVNIGSDRTRIDEAERAGVKSVPALLTPNGNVLHINYGASMSEVKGS